MKELSARSLVGIDDICGQMSAFLEQQNQLRFFGSTQNPPYFHEVHIYFITEMIFLQNIFLAGISCNKEFSQHLHKTVVLSPRTHGNPHETVAETGK